MAIIILIDGDAPTINGISMEYQWNMSGRFKPLTINGI